MNVNRVVAEYLRLRAAKKQLAERHALEMARLAEPMRERENILMQHLNQTGAESIRTEGGTVYKTTVLNARVSDWDSCLQFILSHNLQHMLEKRVSKLAVEEYLAAHGELPPGVAVSSVVNLNVRAS